MTTNRQHTHTLEAEKGSSPSSQTLLAETSNRVRSSLLWIGSTNIVWQLISWAFTLFTARILSPTDYGIMALIGTATPYLSLVAVLSIPTWVIQCKSFNEDEQRATFTLCLLFGSGIGILTFLLAPVVANFYDNPELKLPFQIASLIFFLQGVYAFPEALLRRELAFKPIAIMRLCVGIARAVTTLLLALSGLGYWALVLSMLLAELCHAVWFIYYRRIPGWFAWNPEVFGRAIRFGVVATGGQIFWIVFSTADELIIGKLLSVEILGYYALAFMLIDLPISKVSAVVKPVVFSYFSRLKDNPEQLRQAFLKTLKGVSALVFPALFGLAVVAREAVPLFLGEKWLPIVTPLIVLCIVGVLRTFVDYVSTMFLVLGSPKHELFVNFISALIMPPLYYFLAIRYGLNGILAAWLIGFPLIIVLALLTLKRLTGIKCTTYAKASLGPFLASSTMALVCVWVGSLLPANLILALVVKVLTGAIVYTTILYVFFRSDVEEFLQLRKQ